MQGYCRLFIYKPYPIASKARTVRLTLDSNNIIAHIFALKQVYYTANLGSL